MSGSAKAGTTAERHTCELRVLIASIVRAPPKRASGESFSPLTKDLHGGRLSGSSRGTSFLAMNRLSPVSVFACSPETRFWNSVGGSIDTLSGVKGHRILVRRTLGRSATLLNPGHDRGSLGFFFGMPYWSCSTHSPSTSYK